MPVRCSVSDLCCYSVNQEGRAGSQPCCLLQGGHGRCTEDKVWVQVPHWSHCRADHHSNDQRDTGGGLAPLQTNKISFFHVFRCFDGKNTRLHFWWLHIATQLSYFKSKTWVQSEKNRSNHHDQLIPGLHQCWGGQGKQSCRLAPPGELL